MMVVADALRRTEARQLAGATLRMLLQRELGHRPILKVLATALAGILFAIARVQLAGEPLPRYLDRLVNDYPLTFGIVIGILAALQMVMRISDVQRSGWLIGWCGSGGRVERYIIDQYCAVVVAALAIQVTSVLCHAATAAALDAPLHSAAVLRSLVETTGFIAGLAAYGLVIACGIRQAGAAIVTGVLLFLVPVIVVAVITLKSGLEYPPTFAILLVLHIPQLNPSASVLGLFYQLLYVMGGAQIAIIVGRTRIAKLP